MCSDDIRPILQQKLLDDVKVCQLKQIEEKKRLKAIENDNQNMWLEVRNRMIEEQKNREQLDKFVKSEMNRLTTEQLGKQVASKQNAIDSQKRNILEEQELLEQKTNEMKLVEVESATKKWQQKQSLANDLTVTQLQFVIGFSPLK